MKLSIKWPKPPYMTIYLKSVTFLTATPHEDQAHRTFFDTYSALELFKLKNIVSSVGRLKIQFKVL